MFHHSDPIERSPRIFKELNDAHPEKLVITNNSIELFSICGPIDPNNDETFQNFIEDMKESAPRIAFSVERSGFLNKFTRSHLREHGYSKEQTSTICNTYRPKYLQFMDQNENMQVFLQQEKELRKQKYSQLEKTKLIDTLSLCSPKFWDSSKFSMLVSNTACVLADDDKNISDIYATIGEQMYEQGYSQKDFAQICSTFDRMLEKKNPQLAKKLAALSPRHPIELAELDVDIYQETTTPKGLFGCCCKPDVTNVHRK